MIVPTPDAWPIHSTLKNPRRILDTNRTWAVTLETCERLLQSWFRTNEDRKVRVDRTTSPKDFTEPELCRETNGLSLSESWRLVPDSRSRPTNSRVVLEDSRQLLITRC
jgi:hypothetical protein